MGDGCVHDRGFHGRGCCWFFMGDSRHPRVDLCDHRGVVVLWVLVVVSVW